MEFWKFLGDIRIIFLTLSKLRCVPVQGVSYSPWTDRAASCSFSGELNVVTFSTSFHVLSSQTHSRKKQKSNQVTFVCHI